MPTLASLDPFFFKRFSKVHPLRLGYTAYARFQEGLSRVVFDACGIPRHEPSDLPPVPDADWAETQVTPAQARHLLWALRETEGLNGCVVEIGSWRGVTTQYLALNTKSSVIGVDPYIGQCSEPNLKRFLQKTEGLANVVLERRTFGSVFGCWPHGPIRFAFIDGIHDYVNVSHDLNAVASLAVSNGMIALHDTDQICFAGCRRAIHEQIGQFELVAHMPNLVLLRVR